MAAGLGFKTFTTGEVLTAGDVNGYLMQGINVFASEAARNAAITSPQEGQFAYTKDNNSLWYYTGSAWAASGATGDIEGVTVTSPLTGGGTSGTVTVGILSGTTSNLGAVQLSDSVSSTSTTLAATANAVKQAYDLAASAGGSTNVAGKNGVLNSNFSVWQRGTSFSLAASTAYTYLADRWATSTGANLACTISRQATGDTTNLPFIQYALRYQRNSGQTGTTGLALSQNFETLNSIAFAGKTITMSFYARAGANYSAASSALSVFLATGTGTDQNQQTTGFSGQALPINAQTAILTTTWQRFTFSATIATTATQLCPIFQFTPVGTAGANDYYEITGVQLEIAGSASAYSPNNSTYAGELAACQRYYFRMNAANNYSAFGQGNAGSGTLSYMMITHPVTMRTVASSADFSGLAVGRFGSAVFSVSAVTLQDKTTNITLISTTNSNSSYAAGSYCQLNADNNASAFIGLSAEL